MQIFSAEYNKLHFVVMAVEASAMMKGISVNEMYRRLDRVNLVQSLLIDCYDVMHTQSLQIVAQDVVEALENWENDMSMT